MSVDSKFPSEDTLSLGVLGDTLISRTAAGTIAIGNGTVADASGTLEVAAITLNGASINTAGPTLKVDGTPNVDQTTLDLSPGEGIAITDNGDGSVSIASSFQAGHGISIDALTGVVSVDTPVSSSRLDLSNDGAVDANTPADYLVSKAGVCAMTLAAPIVTEDDGNPISFVSATDFAHTLTATGLLLTGSVKTDVATFAAYAGAGLKLEAYQGKWLVIYSVGVTFS